jgi:nicotinamidase-related amidase
MLDWERGYGRRKPRQHAAFDFARMDSVRGQDESDCDSRDPSRFSKGFHMTSEPIRDPRTDPLLTPQNAALIVVDYQPSQIQSVRSMDHDLLVDNIVSVARLGKTYGLPIVLSTVNVVNGQGPTLPELKAVLSDSYEIDRTQINSWEDVDFRRAVEATGRKKLIMAALWTEVCLAFPTLDALREGFEVYPVVDAVGGTSPEAHRAGLERIVQAGAQPISWVSLACELQRDWARVETVPDVVDIVLTTRLLKSA